jgi:hypothetical protein
VVGEERRAVGRPDARRVEEVLDREPAAGRAVAELRDPDAFYDSQSQM